MGMRDINYHESYRSGYDDIVEAFLHPSVDSGKSHKKAGLYPSIAWLELWSHDKTVLSKNAPLEEPTIRRASYPGNSE